VEPYLQRHPYTIPYFNALHKLKRLTRAGHIVCGKPYRSLASLILELHWRRGDVGVRLHRFRKVLNGGREAGKNPRVGKARRGIRI